MNEIGNLTSSIPVDFEEFGEGDEGDEEEFEYKAPDISDVLAIIRSQLPPSQSNAPRLGLGSNIPQLAPSSFQSTSQPSAPSVLQTFQPSTPSSFRPAPQTNAPSVLQASQQSVPSSFQSAPQTNAPSLLQTSQFPTFQLNVPSSQTPQFNALPSFQPSSLHQQPKSFQIPQYTPTAKKPASNIPIEETELTSAIVSKFNTKSLNTAENLYYAKMLSDKLIYGVDYSDIDEGKILEYLKAF